MARIIIVFLLQLLHISSIYGVTVYNQHNNSANKEIGPYNINSLLQDKTGFIWIGTDRGISRYDGKYFKTYTDISDGERYVNNRYVYALFEDNKERIWAGTGSGLFLYDAGQEKFSYIPLTRDTEGIKSSVVDIKGGKDECIYVLAEDNLYIINPELNYKIECIEYPVSLQKNGTPNLLLDKDGILWVSIQDNNNKNALYKLSEDKKELQEINIKSSDGVEFYIGFITSLLDGEYGQLIISTFSDGVFLLDKKEGIINKRLNIPDNIKINTIYRSSIGNILIGSDIGLVYYYPESDSCIFAKYTQKQGGIKGVSYIIEDKEGGIWLGRYYGGLDYISPAAVASDKYSLNEKSEPILWGDVISLFTQDLSGNLWIATNSGHLYSFIPSTGEFISKSEIIRNAGFRVSAIDALYVDETDLWIGMRSGNIVSSDINTGEIKQVIPAGKGENLYRPARFYKDNYGNLWIGARQNIIRKDAGADIPVNIKDNSGGIADIVQCSNGKVWVASFSEGLFSYDYNTREWKQYLHSDNNQFSLPENKVIQLYIDDKDVLWVATDRGLCSYNSEEDNFKKALSSFSEEPITGITSYNGFLWLATSKGLVMYNSENEEYNIFNQYDGLLGNKFIQGALTKPIDGKIYIGQQEGITILNLDNIHKNQYRPPVLLTNIRVNGENVQINEKGILTESTISAKKLKFSHNDRIIEFDFAALSYVSPEKNKYSYKLEGFDRNWINITDDEKAKYSDIPPGDYILKVKGSNNDGVWNPSELTVFVSVMPLLLLSRGFIILYILIGIVGTMILIYSIDRRHVLKFSRMEEEMEQRRKEEIHNNKIQFFNHISHEIRTPLSMIMAPFEKLRISDVNVPKYMEEDFKAIERNTDHLLSLVNQWLDFQKIDGGKYEMSFSRVNIGSVVEKVSARFTPMLELRKIKVIYDISKDLPCISADITAIDKIISNLISNAVKYTENEIIISCFYNELKDEVCFSVSDNGSGIPEKDKENIFKPFYRVSGNTKLGTGIGLSLVNMLCDANKGQLRLKTNNTGSTFTVGFPVAAGRDVQANEEGNQTVVEGFYNNSETPLGNQSGNQNQNKNQIPDNKYSDIGKNITVLFVEDDSEIRSYMESYLKDEFSVITAPDGIKAVELLEYKEIDIIVSDVMMPGMDGLTLCGTVKSNEQWSHIPVILLTAKTSTLSKIEGLDSGADAYIEKPFSLAHIKAQIVNLLRSRQALRDKFVNTPLTSIADITTRVTDKELLKKINLLIEEHISDPSFSIEEMASALGISRSGLFTKIKQITGFTPNDLVRVVRLKQAAKLLISKQYRINEVALMVGFNSPSYFARSFVKQFNMTPKEFVGSIKDTKTYKELQV